MNFKDLLNVLIERIDGSVAAFFCGTDGIGVENVTYNPEIEVAVTEVEMATALKVVTDVAHSLGVGRVSELFIETEQITAIIEKIQDDYFLCVLLKKGSNIGRGRLEIKKLATKINNEL